MKFFVLFSQIVIRNLVFSFNETSGELTFREIGQNIVSHSSLLNTKSELTSGWQLDEMWGESGVLRDSHCGQVAYVNVLQGIEKAAGERFFVMPCNLDWSKANSRRFALSAPASRPGKCLKFVASSLGDIFVVFATNPDNEWTWYFVQISSYGVAIYKAGIVVTYKLDASIGSLKDEDLFRRFFICMNFEWRETAKSQRVLGLYIQYGVIEGYDAHPVVHLAYFDESPLEPRFYMFGSYDARVFVYDIDVREMSVDEEARMRCSHSPLDATASRSDVLRCRRLCHDNCIGRLGGCFRRFAIVLTLCIHSNVYNVR